MFSTRVTPRFVNSRLDAEHFDPADIRSESLVADGPVRVVEFGTLADEGTTITYGIVQPGQFQRPGVGVRMVRCTDLRGLGVTTDQVLWVSDEIDRPYARSRVLPGDVLIGIAGSLGVIGLAPQGIEPANLNQSVARIRCSKQADSHWIGSFLSSEHGQRLLRRRAVGAVQRHLNLEDLPGIPIPVPDDDAQAYIGNKVRQAEALRARARALVREAEGFFASLHTRSDGGWRGSWRREPRILAEGRLDAWFYATAPTDLESRLIARGAQPVGNRVKSARKNGFDASKAIQYFEIGNLDIATGCAWSNEVAADAIPSRAQRSVRAWDILVSTVRPERKNVALVGPDCTGQLVASSGFAVLRATTPYEAAFVCWFLRSDGATDQLLRWNTGAAYPAIDDDVPSKVLMPEYGGDEVKRHGSRWMKIPKLLRVASELTTAARLLVEALIEQKVTEANLMAAHRSPEADRALLERLTAFGIDAPEANPLFPDLDQLEELLTEAQVEEAE